MVGRISGNCISNRWSWGEWGQSLTTGERFAAHMVNQGVISWAQGNGFSQGAISGLAGHAARHITSGQGWNQNSLGHIFGRSMVAGSIGYMASKATGGDGASGAIAAVTVQQLGSWHVL